MILQASVLAVLLAGSPARASLLDADAPAAPKVSSMDLVWNLLKEDQLERSIELLRGELKKTPDHALMRYALGVCLASTGEGAQAFAELKRAAELDPSFPQTWYYLRTLAVPGDRSTLEFFRKAAARNRKGNPHIHLNYGLLLLSEGRVEKAVASFRKAADLSAAYAEAYFEIGASRYDQGRWSDANASLRKALEIDPAYPEAKRLLALSLAQAGEPAEVVESYRKQALDLKPELAENEDALLILADKEKSRKWEENLARVGKLYLAPLKPVGLMLSPLVPFLEREPMGRTVERMTSSGTARGGEEAPGRGPRRPFSKLAIKWTSVKHLEPLPFETLSDPDNFSFAVRAGGRKLLWAFFTTPNYRLSARAAGKGRAALELRRIPPVQVRFDPAGTVIHQGVHAAGERFDVDGQWDAEIVSVDADVVRLKVARRN